MYRMGKEELAEIKKVVEAQQLFRVGNAASGHHKEANNFEREWAETINSEYCLFLSGGTVALESALVGLGIGPGDEVIVPGYTFMATAIAVLAVGAIPVIVDIDESLTIDPSAIETNITPETKAVIPVHMVGFPSNMEKIMEIAQEHDIKVIEDACQAVGGSFQGSRLGSIGDVGAFSFNYYKVLSCGEGGAITTDDEEVYERAMVYSDGGSAFRPYTSEIKIPIFTGSQYRSNEISGAIMRMQLRKLDGILNDLREIKGMFLEELAETENLKFIKSNDIKGDCGTTVGFSFEEEEAARKFATARGVEGWLPIDSGKHVYENWEPILKKRGAHHPALNPYNLPQNEDLRMDYAKDMLPRTLDILKRTVYISLHPDWSQEEVCKRITACKEVAKEL